MKRIQSATSIDQNPEQERNARMRRYTIAMTVRMICLVLGVFTQGPLMWVFFAGAIFLPYFAVVAANVQSSSKAPTLAVAPTQSIKASDFVVVEEPGANPPGDSHDK